MGLVPILSRFHARPFVGVFQKCISNMHVNLWRQFPLKWFQEQGDGSKNGVGITSLDKPPVLDPFFW